MIDGGQLPGIFGGLVEVLGRYGYLAVVGLVVTEGFGLPAPGQTVLMVAGALAGTGRLSLALVVGLGWLAATLGDNIGYVIGRFGGRRLVLRFGRYVMLTELRLTKAEQVFDRHGGKIVAVARFVDGLRQVNGIIAGLAGMSWWRFLAFNAAGAAVWTAVWTTAGYLAGDHVALIYGQFRRYERYLLIALGVAVLAVLAQRLIHHGRQHIKTEQESVTDTAASDS